MAYAFQTEPSLMSPPTIMPVHTTVSKQFVRPLPALAVALLLAAAGHQSADLDFRRVYVDLNYGGNGRPGWVRSADFDNDGDIDLVAGGGGALFLYENDGNDAGWARSTNLDGAGVAGANGAVVADVDGDGDVDLISAKFYDEIGWWENPCGSSPCSIGSMNAWTFHTIGTVGSMNGQGPYYYLHDIARGTFPTSDGKLQIIAPAISGSCELVAIKWFEPGSDVTAPWVGYTIESGRSASSDGDCNHAGIDTGDVNGDGIDDVAFSNGWYAAPANPRSSWPNSAWNAVTSYDGISNTLLRDMDGDGDRDLVVAAGHYDGDHDIRWYANPGNGAGSWASRTVGTLRSPECLQVRDMTGDDLVDIVSCDLDWDHWDEEVHNIYIFRNMGGSLSWSQENIAPNTYPGHLLQLADVNVDQLPDIIGEATGYSVVSYFENETQGISLPIELASIDAVRNGSTAYLTWTASHDAAAAGFGVEFSDGGPFAEVGYVDAEAGGLSRLVEYNYAYALPSESGGRFRLRLVDLDGSYAYSPTVLVAPTSVSTSRISTAWPNPTSESASVTLQLAAAQSVEVAVYDVAGRHIETIFSGPLTAGSTTLDIDLADAPVGTYFIKAAGERFVESRKIVVSR